MQKLEKLMLPLTLIMLVILGWTFFANSGEDQSNKTGSPSLGDKVKSYETKTAEMGEVMVEITPVSSARYNINLNTHTVELDFDFTEITKLEDNNGFEYEPVSWSGGRGGHHLNGELLFSTINPKAVWLKLTISEIENEEISFQWSVQ